MRLGPATLANVAGSVVLAFLVLPILAVVPASFNHASFIRLPPDTWSLRWYQAFLNDPEWLRALIASTRVALLAMVISVLLGTLAALGLERVPARARRALLAIVISPLIVPVIMTSIALYYVMRPLGLHGTILGLALGHTLLAVPFVVVNVGISLRGVDPYCVRAAEGLGASPWRVFRTVTLPLIVPGLAGEGPEGGARSGFESFVAVRVRSQRRAELWPSMDLRGQIRCERRRLLHHCVGGDRFGNRAVPDPIADGGQRVCRRAVGTRHRHVEQRAPLLGVTAVEHRGQRRFEARKGNVRQEAEPAEVHADHRHVVRGEPPRDGKHRSVASEHDGEIGAACQRVVVQDGDAVGRSRLRGFGVERDRVPARQEKRRQLRQGGGEVGAAMAADQRDARESGGRTGGHAAIKP